SVLIRYGNGDGTYTNGTGVSTASESTITAVDLNGDGFMDFHQMYVICYGACTTTWDYHRSVWLNPGDGGGSWFNVFLDQSYRSSGQSEYLVSDHFMNGSKSEIVATGFWSEEARLNVWNGDGIDQIEIAPYYIDDITIGDFNSDNRADYFWVVDWMGPEGTFVAYQPQGSNQFVQQLITSSESVELGTGDVDGNGWNEVLESRSDGIYIYYIEMGGCVDETACNYDPNMFFDDGSCCFGVCDCDDPQATNYNPDTDCSADICTYAVQGILFDGTNENGTFDQGETPLPNIPIQVQPNNLIFYTNEDGTFNLGALEVSQTTLTIDFDQTGAFTFATNPDVLENPSNFDFTYLEVGLSTGQFTFPEVQTNIISYTQ
ncbi:MAG: hypothetical protein AAF193_11375, partial [Bacteroidota bacterium]